MLTGKPRKPIDERDPVLSFYAPSRNEMMGA